MPSMYSIKQKAKIVLNSASSKCEKTTTNFRFNPKAIFIDRDYVNLTVSGIPHIDYIDHGLVNGDIVVYSEPTDGTNIEPLIDATKYVVKYIDPNSFQLCLEASPTTAITLLSKGGVSDISSNNISIIENNSARIEFDDYEYTLGATTTIQTIVDSAATDINIDRYNNVAVNDLLCITDQIVKVTVKNASPNITIVRDQFDTAGGVIDDGTELTQLTHVGNLWGGSAASSKPVYSHDDKYIHFYEPSNSLAVDDYLEINDEIVKIKTVSSKNTVTVTPTSTIPAQDTDTDLDRTEFTSTEYEVGDLLSLYNTANQIETVQIKAITAAVITVEREIALYGNAAPTAKEFASGVAITVTKYEKYEILRQQFNSASSGIVSLGATGAGNQYASTKYTLESILVKVIAPDLQVADTSIKYTGNFAPTSGYIIINSECLEITGNNTATKTLTVDRAELGTTAAIYPKNTSITEMDNVYATKIYIPGHTFVDDDKIFYHGETVFEDDAGVQPNLIGKELYITRVDSDYIKYHTNANRSDRLTIETQPSANTTKNIVKSFDETILSNIAYVAIVHASNKIAKMAHGFYTDDIIMFRGDVIDAYQSKTNKIVLNQLYKVVYIDKDSFSLKTMADVAVTLEDPIGTATEKFEIVFKQATNLSSVHSQAITESICTNYRFNMNIPLTLNEKSCLVATEFICYPHQPGADDTKEIGGVYIKNMSGKNIFSSEQNSQGVKLLSTMFLDEPIHWQNNNPEYNYIPLPSDSSSWLNNGIDIYVDGKSKDSSNNYVNGNYADDNWILTLNVYDIEDFEYLQKELSDKVKNVPNAFG